MCLFVAHKDQRSSLMVLKSAELSETSFHELSWPAPLNQDKYCPDTEARDGYMGRDPAKQIRPVTGQQKHFQTEVSGNTFSHFY